MNVFSTFNEAEGLIRLLQKHHPASPDTFAQFRVVYHPCSLNGYVRHLSSTPELLPKNWVL